MPEAVKTVAVFGSYHSPSKVGFAEKAMKWNP